MMILLKTKKHLLLIIKLNNMKRVKQPQTTTMRAMIRKHKAWTKGGEQSSVKIGNKVKISVESGYYVARNLEEGC